MSPWTTSRRTIDAIYLGIGAHEGWSLGIPGEEGEGVMSAVEFLNKVNSGETMDVKGKKVLIIGGGNSAVDAARVSWRMGADFADHLPAYPRGDAG